MNHEYGMELFKSRLACARSDSKGGVWAKCPAHDDKSPSLHVFVGSNDGRLVISCKSGCKSADILSAVGLSWRDILDKPTEEQKFEFAEKKRDEEFEAAKLRLSIGAEMLNSGETLLPADLQTLNDARATVRRLKREQAEAGSGDDTVMDNSINVLPCVESTLVNSCVTAVADVTPSDGAASCVTRDKTSDVTDVTATVAIENDADTIAKLAKLSLIQYDRVRSDAASKLGIRAETLDRAVKGQRQESSETTGGQAFEIAPPIPWDFPVNGSALLDCVRTAFTARAKLPDHADVALSLWCLNTYVFDRSRVLPILALTSAQKRCGKTTTLSIVAAIVRCPLPASNISPAALFRAVEKWQPTLLIDEADSFVADDEALRGIVNSGHTKSAAFVIRTVGDNHEPRMFSTWCPKLFAGIGDLPDTIADRSINVRLKRKLSTEKVLPTRCDGVSDLVDIPRQCQRWAIDHGGQLKGADPSLPDVGNDRAKDNWRPLVAIADLCGGNWPVLVREAMKAMTTVEPDDNASIMLLTDIQDTFDNKKTDRVFTADLIDALIQLDDRPWPGWFRGKPITTHQVAKLLKPFGIFPRQIRYAGENKKGYVKADFADAAARYLPKNGETNETTKQAFINNALQRCGNETKSTNVSDKSEYNALIHNDCFVVSDKNARMEQAGGLRQRGEI